MQEKNSNEIINQPTSISESKIESTGQSQVLKQSLEGENCIEREKIIVSGVKRAVSTLGQITKECYAVEQILAIIESQREMCLTNEFIVSVKQLEQIVKDVWQDVLKIDQFDISDNFFDLGGTSFDAVILISKLNQKLKIDISNLGLFEKPTIRSMTEMLKAKSVETRDKTIDASRERGKRRRTENLARRHQNGKE